MEEVASRHGHLALSGIAGSVSLACWMIVFTPQLYENWRRKSCEGLSLAFVIIWLAGDVFNVLGAAVQHVLPTMILLAVYYTLADVVLLWQCLVYGRRKPLFTDEDEASAEQREERQVLNDESQPLILKFVDYEFHRQWVKDATSVGLVIICGVIGYLLSDHTVPEKPSEPQPISITGQVFGWICAVLYLMSRLPQIHLNYQRKSTDGIAPLFFVFAALGNITYCISIFAADSSRHFLILNASWILGAAGSLLLDFAILAQFFMYA